jgi:hypothetical protein
MPYWLDCEFSGFLSMFRSALRFSPFLAFTSHREARHSGFARPFVHRREIWPSSGNEVMIDGGSLAYRSGIASLCSIHTRFTYMYMNMPLPVTFILTAVVVSSQCRPNIA